MDLALRALCIATTALVVSCGGGSGGGDPGGPSGADTLAFHGTVAIGDALSGQTVQAQCGTGALTASAPTSGSGSYTLQVSGTLPCTLSVVEPVSGVRLRALATQEGVVNVSPLTETVFVFADGQVANLPQALAKLGTLMSVVGSPLAGDPTTTAFAADGTGIDANILDLTSYMARRSGSSATTGPGALLALPSAVSSIHAACTRDDWRCIFKESLFTGTSQLVSTFGGDLLDELDSELLGSLGSSWWLGSMEPATSEAIERSVKFGLALLVKKYGDDMMRASGAGRELAKKIAGKMAKAVREGTTSNAVAALRDSGKKTQLVGLLVGVAVNAAVDAFEEATMPRLTLDGSWNEAIDSFLWGTQSFALEVTSSVAVYCAFTKGLCSNGVGMQLVTLVAEVESALSWIGEDLGTVLEILDLQNEVEDANARNAVQEALLIQVGRLTDPFVSGAYTWATTGGMNGALLSIIGTEIEASRTGVDGLFPAAVTQEWRVLIREQHSARLDRLLAKWSAIETACRAWKATEDEVGVSKCLNAMRVSPRAPLSCPTGKVLHNGVCDATSADLTMAAWMVLATDRGGNRWDGSLLLFDSQTPLEVDQRLAGSIDWQGSNGSFGRETFTGTLFANGHLSLTGQSIVAPSTNLVLGSYAADVTPAGNRMINGIWSAIGGVASDQWTAVAGLAALVEPDSSAWRLRLAITGPGTAPTGSVGYFAFTKLRCGGTVSYKGKDPDGRYRFGEQMTYGPCTTGCDLLVNADLRGYAEVCVGGASGNGTQTYAGTLEMPRPKTPTQIEALLGSGL